MEGQRDEDEPEEAGARHMALTAEGPVLVYEGEAMSAALAPLSASWARRHGHPPDWAVALIELRPHRLFSHDAGRRA